MSQDLSLPGKILEFYRSDSRVVTRMSTRSSEGVQGPMAGILMGLSGTGMWYQVPSLLKADGAGYMRPKRSRQLVARSMSRLGEVYHE